MTTLLSRFRRRGAFQRVALRARCKEQPAVDVQRHATCDLRVAHIAHHSALLGTPRVDLRSSAYAPPEHGAAVCQAVAAVTGHHAVDSRARLVVVKALASLDPHTRAAALTTPRSSALALT